MLSCAFINDISGINMHVTVLPILECAYKRLPWINMQAGILSCVGNAFSKRYPGIYVQTSI